LQAIDEERRCRMSVFKFEQMERMADRAFLDVDGKYSVTIIRTDEGLIIDVLPQDWQFPSDTFTVWDDDNRLDDDSEEDAA
jgi:hypothetical protein